MVVYELTCPACRSVMRSSFMRLGAVVDCTACKRRFLVNADLIKHQVVPVSGEVLTRLSTEFAAPAPAVAHATPFVPPASTQTAAPAAPTTSQTPSAPEAPATPSDPPKPRKRKWLLMLGCLAFAAAMLTMLSLRLIDTPAVQHDIQSAAVSLD